MAKRERTIDQTYNALRPRLRNLAKGVGGVTVVIPAHTHAASQISFDPNTDDGGYLDAFDVQTALEELDFEKLARSGVQPMLGSLDMNGFNIIDPVTISMDSTAETLIRYLDAIEFDLAGEHTTHTQGAFHWDPDLQLLVLDQNATDQIPMASAYVRVKSDYAFAMPAGTPVRVSGTFAGPNFLAVQRCTANDFTSFDGTAVLGVTLQAMNQYDVGWICLLGYLRAPGAFAGLGGATYLDANTPAGLTTAPPDADQRGGRYTVRVGYVESDDVMIVDRERIPGVQDLSDVVPQSAVTPTCGDVLVRTRNASSDAGQWMPTGLWTEVELDFGTTDRDEKVFEWIDNQRVHSDQQRITIVPSAKPVAGRDEDEAEFDVFACSAIPFYDGNLSNWKIRAYVHSLRGPVVGAYTFQYTVSNADAHNCAPPG